MKWRHGGIFDPATAKELVVEIKFGTGGDDSKLFVEDLSAAYLKYADNKKLKPTLLAASKGYFAFKIKGKDAWKAFKHESGKHVVQRVPPTETKGRRQTSVISVSVMPVFDFSESKISNSEIKITTQRGSGPGGQHRNTTDSAVRAKHIPTGIEVFIDGRDQHQNKQEALRILNSRVNSLKYDVHHEIHNEKRAKQLGDGGRTGKVRTYNFINGFVTDHRLGSKTNQINKVMKGQFDILTN